MESGSSPERLREASSSMEDDPGDRNGGKSSPLSFSRDQEWDWSDVFKREAKLEMRGSILAKTDRRCIITLIICLLLK